MPLNNTSNISEKSRNSPTLEDRMSLNPIEDPGPPFPPLTHQTNGLAGGAREQVKVWRFHQSGGPHVRD